MLFAQPKTGVLHMCCEVKVARVVFAGRYRGCSVLLLKSDIRPVGTRCGLTAAQLKMVGICTE